MLSAILTFAFISHVLTANMSVQQQITALKHTVHKLNEHVEKLKYFSRYCSRLPKWTCGPCHCVDNNRLEDKYFCDCQNLAPKRDCLQFYEDGLRINGLYKVHQNNLRILQVYCDQISDGGGWTVFQRRIDGSVTFHRDWSTYEKGFGNLLHEFWLGNKNLFTLSFQGLYPKGNELRIELFDWEGNERYAKYDSFKVGNAMTKYQIWLSGYTGNAEHFRDGMSETNGKRFSTIDRNHDTWSRGSCALNNTGGWWYRGCDSVNLNGKFSFLSREYYLKFVEMKIRRKL